jgi:hypothetical protein
MQPSHVMLFAGAALLAANSRAAPPVMAWVPAYGQAASLRALAAQPAVGRGLTRLGLQFWNPGADGKTLVYAPLDQSGKRVDDAAVTTFRDWARSRNIAVMLTVYNNSQVLAHWDWPLARRAFADQRDAFIAALIAEMERHQLDGIDLDLEGEGAHDADRAAYRVFVAKLSLALRARGKLLTVDSFHSPCDNAPNMAWWADWIDSVDAIHSMGYEDLYEGSTASFTPPGRSVCAGGAAMFKYSWQVGFGQRAGYRAEQIVLGMPTWRSDWGSGGLGSAAVAHVREAQALGAGIALWDLQLSAPAWRGAPLWEALRQGALPPGRARPVAGRLD